MGKKAKIFIVIALGAAVIFFFLGIYLTVDEKIPDNAVVVVTLEDKLYHSIHFDYICVAKKTLKSMPLSEARGKGFKADPHCEDLGYFRGNTLFLYQYVFSRIGLQFNSRWGRNGDWLW